jgi:hypothetical protein
MSFQTNYTVRTNLGIMDCSGRQVESVTRL